MEMTYYETFKNKVKARDGKACRRCGFDKNLEVHHILARNEYPLLRLALSNGVTLCGNCRCLLEGKESSTDMRRFLPDDLGIDNQLNELLIEIDDRNLQIDPKDRRLLEGVRRSGKAHSIHAEYCYRQGKKYYDKGAYASAVQYFDKAVLLETDPWEVYYFRGQAKFYLERYKSAIYDFDNTICRNPAYWDAYYFRGQAKYCLARYDAACDDFDMALLLNPDDDFCYRIYYQRGWAKREIGRLADAIADFDTALRMKPVDAEVYRARGLTKLKMERLADAITDFNEGISLLRDALNYCYAKATRPENYCENEAKNLAVDLQLMYINRGSANQDFGNIDEARQDFQMALKMANQTHDPRRWIEGIEKKIRTLSSFVLHESA